MLAKSRSRNSIDLAAYQGRRSARLLGYDLHSVYVITCGSDSPCKVGVARDPSRRLATLQTGQPGKLSVRFLLWTPTSGVASKIERRVHKDLKRGGLHVTGEWFKARPDRAADSILSAAAELFPSVVFFEHDQVLALLDSDGFGSRLFTNYSDQERNFLARAFAADPKSPVLPKMGIHMWAEVLKPMSQVRIVRRHTLPAPGRHLSA